MSFEMLSRLPQSPLGRHLEFRQCDFPLVFAVGWVLGPIRANSGLCPPGRLGDGLRCLRVAKHVPAAPYGLDMVIAACRMREFLAQLTDKDVDDFELGLVHSPVEVVR